jgi:MinD-like ATPase involved in chromosome partitioning or flagellar assembly/Flp pilus assembly protein TadD
VIYTFYSYKGGAGRSMAVANIARCFKLAGSSVVVVDWDLEAPGLETFFCPTDQERERVRSELGLVDLLVSYKRRFPTLMAGVSEERSFATVLDEDLASLSDVLQPVDGDRILLLSAGWRAGARFVEYAYTAQSFDWTEFYASYEGEAYFEWFRKQLLRSGDVVLIDSRTGITEMGGVCTRQLADVVVSFCAPNVQNLGGVIDMAASFRRDDLRAARQRDLRRDLEVVIVPTRIDLSETDDRKAFEREFRAATHKYTPLALRSYRPDFWDLRIPYVPKYAYRERLAVGEEDGVEELQTVYKSIATHLAALAPEDRSTVRKLWDDFSRATSGPPATTRVASLFSLPFLQDPYFTGRDNELAAIAQGLEAGRVVAVTGLAGIGKTALAVEYGYRNRGSYDVVWLVPAGGGEQLEEGYRPLAEALGISPSTDGGYVEAVRHWLELNSRWLVILDDVGGPDALLPRLPHGSTGHLLVTSRDADWSRVAATVELSSLARDDAARVLLGRTGRTEEQAARDLALEVGDLPLAIIGASDYIVRTGRSLRDYVGLLRTQGHRVLGEPLVETMVETVEKVESESTVAAELLAIAGFLGRENVPYAIFTAAGDVLETPLGEAARDAVALDDAVAILRRHSLVELGEGTLRFQPLVQLAAREHVRRSDDPPLWLGRALQVALCALEHDEHAWPHVLAAIEHALRLAEQHESAVSLVLEQALPRAEDPRAAAAVLVALGRIDFRADRFADAVEVAKRAVSSDPVSVRAWLLLSDAYRQLGDVVQALSPAEQAVALDPSSAIVHHTLALALAAAGWEEAAASAAAQAASLAEEAGDDAILTAARKLVRGPRDQFPPETEAPHPAA